MSALLAETPTLEFEIPIIGIWSRRTGPLAVQRSIVTFAPGVECYQCRRMVRLRWVLFDNDADLYRNEMEFREWVNRRAAEQGAHLVEIGTGWGASFTPINLVYGSLPNSAQRFKEWARRTRGNYGQK